MQGSAEITPQEDASDSSLPCPSYQTRGYQQEMLDASLKGNIIIAQDTGSGKTRIAVLRIKIEAERNTQKLSWFLAPTVALCEQQRDVIALDLPVPVGLISGALHPEQWKSHTFWRSSLQSHRVMVSTPQVLLDALRHGYISLGRDISLIVFDEAHHAVDNHPYNCIMKEFYFKLPQRQALKHPFLYNLECTTDERPAVLGLTASPVYGGNIAAAFHALEANLDSIIRSPKDRSELAKFVHRPIFSHVAYQRPLTYNIDHLSCNLMAVKAVVDALDINKDPYVCSLRERLEKLAVGPERTRVDQALSKAIFKQNTFTSKGLRDLVRTASEICSDVGPWAADWYVQKVVETLRERDGPYAQYMGTWDNKEKKYLFELLSQVTITPVSYDPDAILAGLSDKTHVLVDCLQNEKVRSESYDLPYSGLVFVTRRDAVIALAEVLSHHPELLTEFRIGCLIGSSDSKYRTSMLDITRKFIQESHSEIMLDFRSGEKNLIIATSVAEEGLDVQACGNVIRWDPPVNMPSWVQSRGRARRQRSFYVLLFEEGGADDATVKQWRLLEKQMVDLYNNDLRTIKPVNSVEDVPADEELEFRVESTGAAVTLQSAISHLNHFCAILPNNQHANNLPIYEVDPLDMPEGWHSRNLQSTPPYQGPFGCSVTLPRLLPPDLRYFSTEREYPSKASARQHVALKAYIALYRAKLLNDHLLPLTNIMELDREEEVDALLKDVEKRAGTANVLTQVDPWVSDCVNESWWASELHIDGLPPLLFFTQVCIDEITPDAMPMLFHPVRGEITVTIRATGIVHLSSDELENAQRFTRHIFFALHGVRMEWGRLNFAYLLAPRGISSDELWTFRRKILAERGLFQDRGDVNASVFGESFSFPSDITWVRDDGRHNRVFCFTAWKFDCLSAEEDEELRKRYPRFSELKVAPPFLVVESALSRMNFLVPDSQIVSPQEKSPQANKKSYLLPQFSSLVPLSREETEYAALLPSIIRHITVAMTVCSFQKSLFNSSPSLSSVPFNLLLTALTAPVSMHSTNYERLESLGDSVLKYIVSMQLLSAHPLWHEGYLARRKDHAVSNFQLAKAAIKTRLYQWIIRDRFSPRLWIPRYASDVDPATISISNEDVHYNAEERDEQLSTKVLADVVEALIGAAYLHGGLELGIECARVFGLGLTWQQDSACLETMINRIELSEDVPPQVRDVERMLGYTFRHKLLVVEALTHASYQYDFRTFSYERMEFLGDAVLDVVVTDYLYRVPNKNYAPGQIHLHKSAVVNMHFLAYVCLRCSFEVETTMPMPDLNGDGSPTMTSKTELQYLWQCLLHSSHTILDDQKNTFARYQKLRTELQDALSSGFIFPWAALTHLQAPKFFSDMVESLIGAVYLDSGGSMDAVRYVIRTLGILPCLERIVKDDVDILHPVSRLSIWADREKKTIEYVFHEGHGHVACAILLDGEEAIRVENERRGRASQGEAKFAVAEKFITMWKLREEEKSSAITQLPEREPYLPL